MELSSEKHTMNHSGVLNQNTPPIHYDEILRALNVVHDPRSANDLRHQASQYLEKVREDEGAPEQGFGLASAKDQMPIVRHFGLSLIDYAIRHKWADYTREQSAALRSWVLELAHGSSDLDPAFITNKIAEVWVEVAKRSWAVDWTDMDELLLRLWEGHIGQKMLVLNILETLSDDIFTTEDSVAALRGSDLNRACVEIFIPATVLMEQFPNREAGVNVRCGSEGWLFRLSDSLDQCTRRGDVDKHQQSLTLKVLSTFRSTIGWAVPKALVSTSSVHRICACLAVSDMAVQLVSMSTAHVTCSRGGKLMICSGGHGYALCAV